MSRSKMSWKRETGNHFDNISFPKRNPMVIKKKYQGFEEKYIEVVHCCPSCSSETVYQRQDTEKESSTHIHICTSCGLVFSMEFLGTDTEFMRVEDK